MSTDSSVILTKKVTITSPNPVTKEDFVDKIGEIARNIGDFLKKDGCTELGHMNFISTTDGEDCLQLSVREIGQGPKINGILKKTFEKIKLTLNIIEFGVSKEEIDRKISEEIKSMQSYFDNK